MRAGHAPVRHASCPAVGLLHGTARGCGQGCRRHALTNRCCAGDIVVTQDFGLAMFALAKGAYVIHPWGWRYRSLSEEDAVRREQVHRRMRTLAACVEAGQGAGASAVRGGI